MLNSKDGNRQECLLAKVQGRRQAKIFLAWRAEVGYAIYMSEKKREASTTCRESVEAERVQAAEGALPNESKGETYESDLTNFFREFDETKDRIVFTKVEDVLKAQPLNPLKKCEFTVMPRSV